MQNDNFIDSLLSPNDIFNRPNSQYNGENYKLLIIVVHFFLNRIITVIVKHCHNGNPTGLWSV